MGGKCSKQVVRLGPDAHAVVSARAAAKGVSLSVATDELVMIAHGRIEALRKDAEKRAARKGAPK